MTNTTPVQGRAQPRAVEAAAVGPSIFIALQQQLDLKLEPAKRPGEFLLIDHVKEKPSGN